MFLCSTPGKNKTYISENNKFGCVIVTPQDIIHVYIFKKKNNMSGLQNVIIGIICLLLGHNVRNFLFP